MGKYIFKPRARLLIQLGEQLIKNGTLALTELIKNSYDADATHVLLEMNNIEDTDQKSLLPSNIILTDDGYGMDLDIIQNVWLELGSDYKEKLYNNNITSPKFNRLPMGEKGIGRFGAHKLGNKIKLISKKEGKKEVVVNIDWTIFEKEKYLEDVAIEVIEREPEIFINNKTGTKIIIEDLKEKWTKNQVKEVFRSINSLVSPFDTLDSFHFEFKINNKNWLEDLLTLDKIKEYSLFYFKGKIVKNKIEEFEYNFIPWKIFDNIVKEKKVFIDNELVQTKILLKSVDTEFDIGPIEIECFIFDFDNEILQYIPDKKTFKEYLKYNSGIRVYRDNIRIYNYGEPDDDWLGLNQRRINRYEKGLNKNIILGKINLLRKDSNLLKEKANREGFLENNSYFNFKNAILEFLEIIEFFRYIDKKMLKDNLSNGKTFKEPVIGNIENLKEVINKKIDSESIKKELNVYINRIEKDYSEIKENLLNTSSYGIAYSITIHEVEKSMKLLNDSIKNNNDFETIKMQVAQLSDILEAHTNLLKKGDPQKDTIEKIVKELTIANKVRMKRHNVELIVDITGYEDKKINCSKKYVENMLINIIDNSIYWLKDIENKKILLKVNRDIFPDYLTFIVADNGPGFKISEEEAKIIFSTTKPFGEGIGLGLYIVDQLMLKHEGKLIINHKLNLNIPKEFEKGAIVCLCFKEIKRNEI